MLVVLRAGAALRVLLDSERGQSAVAGALDRPVVQVPLRDVEVAAWDRGRVDLELVVLARDVHAPGVEVLHGVVGAVMAVRETRRRRARGAAEDLVPEADPEERHLAERLPRELDRLLEDSGVARTVGEHEAVGAGGAHIGPR